MKKIERFFLEIRKNKKVNSVNCFNNNIQVKLQNPPIYSLNKFFYKQIGKKYLWRDKLNWSDDQWKTYVCNKNIYTWIMLVEKEISGFCEIYFHKKEKEIEILKFGILEEYFGNKLGGFFLTEILNKMQNYKIKRVRVHTCSLDHPHALKNYQSRGMQIYRRDTIFRNLI